MPVLPGVIPNVRILTRFPTIGSRRTLPLGGDEDGKCRGGSGRVHTAGPTLAGGMAEQEVLFPELVVVTSAPPGSSLWVSQGLLTG